MWFILIMEITYGIFSSWNIFLDLVHRLILLFLMNSQESECSGKRMSSSFYQGSIRNLHGIVWTVQTMAGEHKCKGVANLTHKLTTAIQEVSKGLTTSLIDKLTLASSSKAPTNRLNRSFLCLPPSSAFAPSSSLRRRTNSSIWTLRDFHCLSM